MDLVSDFLFQSFTAKNGKKKTNEEGGEMSVQWTPTLP